MSRGCSYRSEVVGRGGVEPPTFRTRLTAPPAMVVLEIRGVLAGAGITVLPRYLCAGELAKGESASLHTPTHPGQWRAYGRTPTRPLRCGESKPPRS